MMTTNPQDRVRQEELCVYRYRKNCRALEDKQDEVRAQQRVLEQASEEMLASTIEMHECLESYTVFCDRQTHQKVVTQQNELFFLNADAQRSLAEYQEQLTQTEKRLADEREELDEEYRREMRRLRERD